MESMFLDGLSNSLVLERKDVIEIGVSGTILPGTKDKRPQADVSKSGNDDGR